MKVAKIKWEKNYNHYLKKVDDCRAVWPTVLGKAPGSAPLSAPAPLGAGSGAEAKN